MATSPNYAWAEPDNSSLVKNGAADIRTLGDAIDTSVWNVGYGQAGKNKIINGNFAINQRGTTSSTTNGVFLVDKFQGGSSDGTVTFSVQAFTPGAAPVSGYEAAQFGRIVSTGQTAANALARLQHKIEDVRTFAGQTVTVSFWAKAATGTPSLALELLQDFGSGGSTGVTGLLATPAKKSITTSWARYTFTIAVPSISGKTIGTGSFLNTVLWASAGTDFNARTGSLGIQSNTFDTWGWQIELGSVATPFQLAGGGDPQSELAMCQRYYYRNTPTANAQRQGVGVVDATTDRAEIIVYFPVTMRTAPTALEQSGTAGDYSLRIGSGTSTCTSVPTFVNATTFLASTYFNVLAGLVVGQAALTRNVNTNGYLAWSAEL
jgi:hypothetical protein